MAALRRERGSGTVAALVIFVVLTFVAGGAAVWFAQQASAAKVALKENQDAFEERVVASFEEHKWDMPGDGETGPYNVRFGPKSYEAVRSYLENAALYERLVKVLGWNSPDAVEEALRISPLQQEMGAQYKLLSSLLSGYEQSFSDQKAAIARLRGDLDSLQGQLQEKTKALTETETRLRQDINKLTQEYNAKLDEWRQRNQELAEGHEAQRKQTAEWQQKYDTDQTEAKAKIAELQAKVEELTGLIEELRAPAEGAERLVAEGKVIQVERALKVVIIEGGEDVQRKTDEKLVVYSESRTGERTRKGEIIVTEVHRYTASATVIREDRRLVEGDLFVNAKTWDAFEKG